MGNVLRRFFGKTETSGFITKCIDADSNTFEITGTIGSDVYTVKFSKVHVHHAISAPEAFVIKHKEKGPAKAVKPPTKTHKYSTGLHLYEKAIVKRIPCDQLFSLEMHKERSVGNRERKHMVVRKLHALGGWIREGRHKDRIYVVPGTPLPDYLLPKSTKHPRTTASFELGFQ